MKKMPEPFSIVVVLLFFSGVLLKTQETLIVKALLNISEWSFYDPINLIAGTKFYNRSIIGKNSPFEEEYALKAAFLYRFTEYTEWKNFSDDQYFYVAILGNSPIAEEMRKISVSKKVGNKTMVIKQYASIDEVASCQLLFVSKNSHGSISKVVEKFGNKPTLLVTEQQGYAEMGSHINFFMVENKIKFEANLQAIKKAGISISSQLLQHAIIVVGK